MKLNKFLYRIENEGYWDLTESVPEIITPEAYMLSPIDSCVRRTPDSYPPYNPAPTPL
jgi:hypothetical protein